MSVVTEDGVAIVLVLLGVVEDSNVKLDVPTPRFS